MRYLFLDIDGVLNTPGSKARCGKYVGIDSAKVLLLKYIVGQTGALIILNSTWKTNWEKNPAHKSNQDNIANYLDRKLWLADLAVSDKTPDVADGQYLSRGEGIVEFLNAREWGSFVILDDLQFDYDGCGLTDNFVKTDKDVGLTEELAKKAIEILLRDEG